MKKAIFYHLLFLLINNFTLSYAADIPETALSFLRKNHLLYKMPKDLNDLILISNRESLVSFHLRFKQIYQGLIVENSEILIHISKFNQVEMVNIKYFPGINIGIDPVFTFEQAKEIVSKTLAAEYKTEDMGLIIYPSQGNFMPAYKIIFSRNDPAEKWIYFVDSKTGNILERKNLLRYAVSGKGDVFYPNPIVSAQNSQLEPNLEQNNPVLEDSINAQRQAVVLLDLQDPIEGILYLLTGPYADTVLTPNRATEISSDFIYKRTDPRFEEVMAYYWIDQTQRYIQSLGFNDLLNKPIKINANGPGGNSYYDYGNNSITYGQGKLKDVPMVDEGEDGEIVVHEYGHALMDIQIPDMDFFGESGAIGEGFSDYLAAAFFSAISNGFQDACFADWVAFTDQQHTNPNCLRRLDSNKHYPEALVNEIHADGEIWSAPLYQIHQLLGRDRAAKLIIQSNYYLSIDAKFSDGAIAILKADEKLNTGENKTKLMDIFVERGIFSTANIDKNSPGSENRIDGFDLLELGAAFGFTKDDLNWNANADLSRDNIIDGSDLAILANIFGKLLP